MEAGSEGDGNRQIDVEQILQNELRLGAFFTERFVWVQKWKKRIFWIVAFNVVLLLAIEITLSQIWPDQWPWFVGGQFTLLMINNLAQHFLVKNERLELIFNRRHPFEF